MRVGGMEGRDEGVEQARRKAAGTGAWPTSPPSPLTSAVRLSAPETTRATLYATATEAEKQRAAPVGGSAEPSRPGIARLGVHDRAETTGAGTEARSEDEEQGRRLEVARFLRQATPHWLTTARGGEAAGPRRRRGPDMFLQSRWSSDSQHTAVCTILDRMFY